MSLEKAAALNESPTRDGGHGKPYLYQRMRPHLCPGCTARILEMNPAPCAICGRENPITASSSRAKMHPIARLMRVLLAPLGRGFHILTAVFCFFLFWSMTLHGVTPFFGIVELGLIFSGLLVISIWMTRLVTRAAVYLFAPATRQTPRPGAKSFLVLPVGLAVLEVSNHFYLPLRVVFWPQRGMLEQVVNSAFTPGGIFPPPPIGAGIYQVKDIEISGRNVRFEVTEDIFISGTKAGFAKCPDGCQNARFPQVWGDWSSPTKYKHLSNDWYWWEARGSNF